MWLFTRYGFFSVSVYDKRQFAIRTRAKKHLEQLQARLPFLKRYEIIEDQRKDYRWRIIIPRNIWIDAMLTISVEQRWSNFKNEAARFCPDVVYNEVLHTIWSVLYRAGRQWDHEQEVVEEKTDAKSIVHKS